MKKITALLLCLALLGSLFMAQAQEVVTVTESQSETVTQQTQITETEENKSETEQTEEDKSEGTPTEEDKSEVTQTEEDKSEVTQTEEDKSEVMVTQEDKSEVTQTEEDKSEVVITEEDKSEVAVTEENKSEIVVTEEDKSEVIVTEEDKSEVVVTEEDKSEVVVTEENKTECMYLNGSGEPVYGEFDAVYRELSQTDPGEEKYTLWLCTETTLMAEQVARGTAAWFEFLPDGDFIHCAEDKTVTVSETDPDRTVTAPAGNPEELIDLYVKVVPLSEKKTEESEEPEEPEIALTYTAENYTAGQWSTAAPVFTLQGIPEEEKYWEYAAVVYGKQFELLKDGSYTAQAEGSYTLRFTMLNDLGDVVCATELIDILCDFTAPSLDYVDAGSTSYTVTVSASDEGSGVSRVSFDAGATWQETEGSASYTAAEKTTLPAGSILVADAAGNIAAWDEEVKLKKISYGGGGGGGGSGKSHSKSTKTETTKYDSVEVQTEDEPMHVLTFDGEELETELLLNTSEGYNVPEDYEPTFRAEKRAWPVLVTDTETGKTSISVPETEDTLLLIAETDENVTGTFEYDWHIGGAALRQLSKSGIVYLTLQVQDWVITLPTEGFLQGETYAELKMNGTSTRKFIYDVLVRRLPDDENGEAVYETEVRVTVNEEEPLTLTGDENQMMYMVNVYDGPKEMLEVPYAPWPEEETEQQP